MQSWRFRIRPLSAFATPLRGDTLFGQLCWALRLASGEEALVRQLEGYTQGAPFCVLSDAFPAGYLPRPQLPLFALSADTEDTVLEKRKQYKNRLWLPLEKFREPVEEWLHHCASASDIAGHTGWQKARARVHNTINRRTGTTGEGEFAPYTVEEHWYFPGAQLDIYALVDESRFRGEVLEQLLRTIGDSGYGKDAGIGRGRFRVELAEPCQLPEQEGGDTWMALAPCAPQGLGYDPAASFWKPFTRYGRHGALAAVSGNPFKNPVLLADTGSVFAPGTGPVQPLGQGLGGGGRLSAAVADAVHQGYAPAVGLNLRRVRARIERS